MIRLAVPVGSGEGVGRTGPIVGLGVGTGVARTAVGEALGLATIPAVAS